MNERRFIEELNSAVKSHHMSAEKKHNLIIVTTHEGFPVISVRADIDFGINTSYIAWDELPSSVRTSITSLVLRYFDTPFDIRIAEESFKFKLSEPFNSESCFLNLETYNDTWLFSTDSDSPRYRTKFKSSEIEAFPDAVKDVIAICKQIPTE